MVCSRMLVTVLTVLALSCSLWAASFSDQLLLTSAGRSSDVLIARQIFTRAGLEEPRMMQEATGDSLAGVETLVLVLGGSGKGLGQAQDAADQELARIESLLNAAEEAGIRIVSMHLGREARRGALSDQFILPVAPRSQHMLVIDGGNKDGLFSTLSEDGGIPLTLCADYVEMVQQVNQLFGLKMPEKK